MLDTQTAHTHDPDVAALAYTAAALGRLCVNGPAAAEILARQLGAGAGG